jgi:endonuclease IV
MDEIIIANLYIGGCSLDTHWSNMQANAAAYDYQYNEWGSFNKSKKSIRWALEDEEWDIITIQQVSQNSGMTETFGNLQNILDYIKQYSKNPDAKIY